MLLILKVLLKIFIFLIKILNINLIDIKKKKQDIPNLINDPS